MRSRPWLFLALLQLWLSNCQLFASVNQCARLPQSVLGWLLLLSIEHSPQRLAAQSVPRIEVVSVSELNPFRSTLKGRFGREGNRFCADARSSGTFAFKRALLSS